MKLSRLLVFFVLLLQYVGTLAQEEDVLRPRGKKTDGSSNNNSSSGTSSKAFNVLKIGIEAGMDYGMFSQNLTGLPSDYTSIIKNGNGIGYYFSVFADENLTEDFGLQVRLGLNNKKFGNAGKALSFCVLETNDTIPMDVDYQWTNNLLYTFASIYFRVNATNNLVVLLGPTLHSVSSLKQTDIANILQPGECYYNVGTPQQSKIKTTETDISPIANSNIWSFDVSVGYTFPIAPKINLVPRIGFHYMLSPILVDENSQGISATDRISRSLQAGLGLWITI